MPMLETSLTGYAGRRNDSPGTAPGSAMFSQRRRRAGRGQSAEAADIARCHHGLARRPGRMPSAAPDQRWLRAHTKIIGAAGQPGERPSTISQISYAVSRPCRHRP
jgi:hypothetical protein